MGADAVFLTEEHVLLDVGADTWAEAIERACAPLVAGRAVTPAYVEDVIRREHKWPTGLPVRPVGVAIPHGEHTGNILRSAISACVLTSPVAFRESGGGDGDDLEVGLVFLLALKNSEDQTDVLCRLMTAISDPKVLTGLLKAKSPAQFVQLFNQYAGT